MKRKVQLIVVAVLMTLGTQAIAQDGNVQTIFKRGLKSSGGYGAVTNKFTNIRGRFVNLSGLYGGWYINHKFMLGLGLSAVTNNLRVPDQFSADPTQNLSYEYGQFGLMTEYVINSGKPVHLVFQMFAGTGFTLQYQRSRWHAGSGPHNIHNEDWFFVAEPGVQVEVNLFKWMRFSPGVSYRASFGSDAPGMADREVRDFSYGATLKFGKF